MELALTPTPKRRGTQSGLRKSVTREVPTSAEVEEGRETARHYTVSEQDLERYLDRYKGAEQNLLSTPANVLEPLLRRVVASMRGLFTNVELQQYVRWWRCSDKAKPWQAPRSLIRKLDGLSKIQEAALENVFVTAWHEEPGKVFYAGEFAYLAGWARNSPTAMR